MLTGEEVMEIRILHRQGKSIRSIATELSISRGRPIQRTPYSKGIRFRMNESDSPALGQHPR